jgi:hypothetical protein
LFINKKNYIPDKIGTGDAKKFGEKQAVTFTGNCSFLGF